MLEAKCPHCGEVLDYDEGHDIDIDCDKVYQEMSGHCPACERKYERTDIFTYEKCVDIREVKEE